MKKIPCAIYGIIVALAGVNSVFAATKTDFQLRLEKSVDVQTIKYLSATDPTDTLDCEQQNDDTHNNG